MSSDRQAIDAVLAGDAEAFGLLVRQYQNRLFQTLYRVTGSREEAEDVAQESFVQAFVKLESFQGRSSFYTWLYRIAFNISVSRQRRKQPVRAAQSTYEDAGREPEDRGESASEQVERRERAAALHTALAALDEDQRRILILRELEGCDYGTIAEILQIPAGTVRSRLHRSRRQLRDILSGQQSLP